MRHVMRHVETGFSDALLHLKEGKRLRRLGWNGGGKYIHLIAPTGLGGVPYLYMQSVDDKLVQWLASQVDILANDWVVVD